VGHPSQANSQGSGIDLDISVGLDDRLSHAFRPLTNALRCTQAAPSTREPFFPAAFRHAAVVVVADEDASLAAEEVANQVIQVQTQHHTALTTAAAEHKAAVAAALSAGQPAPRDTTDDTAAAPSVFTKLRYSTTPHRSPRISTSPCRSSASLFSH
jgi:hypothetical protein